MAKLKTAVLISGRGSNLQALIDYCQSENSRAQISLVISNVKGAAGLEKATEAGIISEVIEHNLFKNRNSFENALTETLDGYGIEFICLAGFMRILTDAFVKRWHNKIINIHPSLLPSFKGLKTHERALQEGVKFTGCTVHFVREEMDTGPIIVQAAVPILSDDDPKSLEHRVLLAEHRCYPLALNLIAENRVTIINEKVSIPNSKAPGVFFSNPIE
ncbi:MAG: phosphoribosylglycinamide formyltransferase [Rhodospirillales bacterium]|nr:phosphoribosylglycinamide formyltransferase [Rhodospirillales bacterium]|tara:strand:- start:2375 stop:3025 length:651 start_codon:yes stop_codon:yes gene_type:complete